MKIEISGEEASKIVEDYARSLMIKQGYKLDYSRNVDETPWPDHMYRGEKIEQP